MKKIMRSKSLKIRFLAMSLGNLILAFFLSLFTFWIFDGTQAYRDLYKSPIFILFIIFFMIYFFLLNLLNARIVFRPIRSLTKELKGFLQDERSCHIDPNQYPEMSDILTSLLNLVDSVKKERDIALVIKNKSEAVVKSKERDVLTGLYSREFLVKFLPDEISRARILNTPISLVMLDVDDFKHYNDANGHPQGDRALKKVADLVQNSVRNYDVSIRYGGEEFCVIMPGAILSNAQMISERIRKKVENESFEFEEKQPGGKLTVSLGVATFPEHASNETELLKFADIALYEAKRAGKNQVSVYEAAN